MSQLRVGFCSLSLPKTCCPPSPGLTPIPSVPWEPVHPDTSAPRSGPRPGSGKGGGLGGWSPFPAQPGFAALPSIPQSLGDEIWAGAVAVATTHHLLMTLEPTCSAAGSDLLVRFPLVGSAQQRALPTGHSGFGSGWGTGRGTGRGSSVTRSGPLPVLPAPERTVLFLLLLPVLGHTRAPQERPPPACAPGRPAPRVPSRRPQAAWLAVPLPPLH